MTTLWASWVDVIAALFELLATGLGLGAGLGVVALTLLLRAAVLPITWKTATQGYVRQKVLKGLQPELDDAKRRFANDPQRYAEVVLAIYRRNGVALFDGKMLLGALVQAPILLGAFTALRQGLAQGRFLWVADLAKPDVLISIVAGVTTAFLALAAPDLPEHVRTVMLIVPAVMLAFTALHFASAIALYWATSNVFSAAQTLAVRTVVQRRAASGRLGL
jgi:YidC/Oxa1 family membrane protein insertase